MNLERFANLAARSARGEFAVYSIDTGEHPNMEVTKFASRAQAHGRLSTFLERYVDFFDPQCGFDFNPGTLIDICPFRCLGASVPDYDGGTADPDICGCGQDLRPFVNFRDGVGVIAEEEDHPSSKS
ncbi:hypothetical protein N7520_003071 [Penicillium odoratum]|uniref:uncharacterized protein n=1 Tax=Penicillium odoratum TaxID=1167516 RepID=UPI0025489CE0|nr:uncharacterized protein N7520_003071 [Penicillium odoratum]KAJ5772542.1 hypothetical protein N7520_003071 [Penicillium odoratum]